MERLNVESKYCSISNVGSTCIVANCPGISGTVPDFLPVSRKGPENLLLLRLSRNSFDCPGKALNVPKLLPVWPHPPQVTISVLASKHFLGATYSLVQVIELPQGASI